MEKGIDFLKAYEKPGRPKELSRIFKVGMFVIVIFYCLLSAAVLSFWVSLRKEHQEVNRQIEVKKTQISQLRKKESLQILLKQRLSSLAKIWTLKKRDFPRFLSFFLQISSEGVDFSEIKISSEGTVTARGTAVNALVLGKFLEKITSSEMASVFSKITLTSVTRQKDGSYNFDLLLAYEKS